MSEDPNKNARATNPDAEHTFPSDELPRHRLGNPPEIPEASTARTGGGDGGDGEGEKHASFTPGSLSRSPPTSSPSSEDRLVLELVAEFKDSKFEGTVAAPGEPPTAFQGWIGLMGVVDMLRTHAGIERGGER
ncbi:MAG: hypothetical protein M1134_03375 [Actinobacteria bacterium]|nr:hypothetical protein [Actinomycetota bacterium]